MAKSKTVRLTIFVFLNFFLFACLSSSGSSGHAATETISEAMTASEVALISGADEEMDGPYQAFTPMVASVPRLTNCRYGIGNEPGKEANKWMDFMGAGHYINFVAKPFGPPVAENVELYPQVRLSQDKENGVYLPSYTISPGLNMNPGGLGLLVQANPGKLWVVGNEPDVVHPQQDDMYPEWYARAYHDVYYFIKQVDPHAQVAIAGLSMMTPGRLQYLDIVWDTYSQDFGEPMPVDVWNMHLYILSEIRPWDGGPGDGKVALGTDPALALKAPDSSVAPEIECPKDDVICRAEHDDMDIFIEQLVALRSWMKDHGQQNKPLILSEFSQLYPFVDYDDPINPTQCFVRDEFGQCFTQDRVSTFLHEAMDYLETAQDANLGYPADNYRLVQQWTWYSLWVEGEHSGGSSNLLVDGYQGHKVGSDAALTKVGQAYRERALGSEVTVNLVAAEAPVVNAQVPGAQETADVEIKVGYLNDGSGNIIDSFKVTFYADAALTQVIGEADVTPGFTGIINGCSWGRITEWASVNWTGLTVGNHSFWAKVDSQNDISYETNEVDNVISGLIIVTP